jgi:hypothetical protein
MQIQCVRDGCWVYFANSLPKCGREIVLRLSRELVAPGHRKRTSGSAEIACRCLLITPNSVQTYLKKNWISEKKISLHDNTFLIVLLCSYAIRSLVRKIYRPACYSICFVSSSLANPRDGETAADLANCVAGLSCIYFDEERSKLLFQRSMIGRWSSESWESKKHFAPQRGFLFRVLNGKDPPNGVWFQS